jgi:hypothetical protein
VPTKSAIFDENKNGKQNNIPKIPAVIEGKACFAFLTNYFRLYKDIIKNELQFAT